MVQRCLLGSFGNRVLGGNYHGMGKAMTPPTGTQEPRTDEMSEQCFYCKQFYPKPVSLHHTITECHDNVARQELERAVIQAALNLYAETGAASFRLPIPGTTPKLYVCSGEAENVESLMRWEISDNEPAVIRVIDKDGGIREL